MAPAVYTQMDSLKASAVDGDPLAANILGALSKARALHCGSAGCEALRAKQAAASVACARRWLLPAGTGCQA